MCYGASEVLVPRLLHTTELHMHACLYCTYTCTCIKLTHLHSCLLWTKAQKIYKCIVCSRNASVRGNPAAPAYIYTISMGSIPFMSRRRLSTISRGLKLGTEVEYPVPIPSHPLTSTIGMIGQYHSGSILYEGDCGSL